MTTDGSRGWRVIDHTADIGLEVYGDDLRQLFERASGALFAQIVDRGRVGPLRCEKLTVSGIDWPDLMFNFLRELFYMWAGRQRLVAAVRVRKLVPYEVRADVNTAGYDPAVHRLREEIKAVTYHQLRVEPAGAGWRARFFLDV